MPQKTSKSAAKGTNRKSASSSNSTTSTNRPLREIIYLDVPRITSYLSQLQGGLKQYSELIQTSVKTDQAAGNEFTWGGGPVPAAYKRTAETSEDQDATAQLERMTAHHAALTVIERLVTEKELIGAIGSGRPFVRYTGFPIFMDYQHLATKLRGMAELLESTVKVGALPEDLDELDEKTRKNSFNQVKEFVKLKRAHADQQQMRYDGYARVFDEYHNQITIYYPDEPVSGALDPSNMLTPGPLLFANYGIPSRVPITMLALDTGGKVDHEPLTAPDDLPEGEERGLGYAAAYMTEAYHSILGSQFSDTKASPVLPIAVYFELKALGASQ